MSIQYAVVRRGAMWCLFQCGQQLQVFASRREAVASARTLADFMRDVAPVDVLVQSDTGELERDLRVVFARTRKSSLAGAALDA